VIVAETWLSDASANGVAEMYDDYGAIPASALVRALMLS
jgi:hypothetical protein